MALNRAHQSLCQHADALELESTVQKSSHIESSLSLEPYVPLRTSPDQYGTAEWCVLVMQGVQEGLQDIRTDLVIPSMLLRN